MPSYFFHLYFFFSGFWVIQIIQLRTICYRPIRPKYPPPPLVKSDFQNTFFSIFQNPPNKVDFVEKRLKYPPPLVKSQKKIQGWGI